MKVGRIAVLGVALATACLAGYLVLQIKGTPQPQANLAKPAKPQMKLENVLVAAADIPMGTGIDATKLKWQEWPKNGIASGYITKSKSPDGLEKASKTIARSAFFEGEPIRMSKLVNSEHGYMSAILPEGQRAVATNISTATSAGGFILPNDHVDVIMTRRKGGEDNQFITEAVLENVRVLAIDQTVEEKDGESVVVGETATLQLSPEQAQILVVAQQMAERLSLTLRSLKDAQANQTTGARYLLSGSRGDGRVKIIKYGRSQDLLVGGKGTQ